MLVREPLPDSLDRLDLVEAVNDVLPDLKGIQRPSLHPLKIHEVLQAVLRVEAVELSRRKSLCIVPHPGFEPVRIENCGPMPMHLFQTVRVQLGLMPAALRIDGCFLGLNDGQGVSVVVPEDIVRVADAGVRGLMFDLDFFSDFSRTVEPLAHIPARAGELSVDQARARCRLVELKRLHGFVCRVC